MNRRSVLLILRFAIVIVIIAFALIFVTDIHAPSFIALTLTIGFCSLVYGFAVLRLYFDDSSPLSKKQMFSAIGIYIGVLVVLAGIKALLVFMS